MDIEFKKSDIERIVKELSTVIVSFDKIGSSAVDLPEGEWEKALIEYIVDTNVTERLAKCRYILDCVLTNEQAESLPESFGTTNAYWSYKEYVSKKSI